MSKCTMLYYSLGTLTDIETAIPQKEKRKRKKKKRKRKRKKKEKEKEKEKKKRNKMSSVRNPPKKVLLFIMDFSIFFSNSSEIEIINLYVWYA